MIPVNDDFPHAQREARAFAENVVMPAICAATDGGVTLARAIIAAIFSDFAENDFIGDMNNAKDLLAWATRVAAVPEERRREMLANNDRARIESVELWREAGAP